MSGRMRRIARLVLLVAQFSAVLVPRVSAVLVPRLSAVLAALPVALFAALVSAQGPSQVAIVIQYGDGTTSTHCVDVAEDGMTGFDALLRTGVDVVYSGGGAGAIVCKIGPSGCADPGQCFCQCVGVDCRYWSYWHLIDGAWQYARLGAGMHKVQPGTVEGWVWGLGSPAEAPEPPQVSFDEICRPAMPATPTPPPTDTPRPTATAEPTRTSEPTATAEPPVAPQATATWTQPVSKAPSPSPTRAPDGRGTPARSYFVFGGIALVLAVVAALVLWRRPSS